MPRPEDYTERARVNDLSRNKATHHTEPWSGDELALLATWDGSEDELVVMAELLGRTVEACRQKFYVDRRVTHTEQEVTTVVARSVTVTTTTRSRTWSVGFCYNCGHFDDLLAVNGAEPLCEDCR